MKKILCATLATGAIFLGMAMDTEAASTADIVFIVDESGSMSGEHAWIKNMVLSLETELINKSVTENRYALVGYGNSAVVPRNLQVGGSGVTWGSAAQLFDKTGSLVINGGTEDGWAGINFANTFSFRSNAAVNYILITDEDRDNTNGALTYNSVLASLKSKNAILNAVTDVDFKTNETQAAIGVDSAGNWFKADGLGGYTTGSGGTATSNQMKLDYVDMAWGTGGAGWDLSILRSGGNNAISFTEAFVKIKVKEIIDQNPVPEPTTMLLFGTGLAGLAAIGRRRKEN